MPFLTDRSNYLSKQGEFFLYDDVSADICLKLRQEITEYAIDHAALSPKPNIWLHINTSGGLVDEGMALGAAIMRVKNHFGLNVYTSIEGVAFSMGLTIAQFGSRRFMDGTSLAMSHDVSMGANPATYVTHSQSLYLHQAWRESIAAIFASRNTAGHNTTEYWLENGLNRDNYYTAVKALELGLIDEIVGGLPTP